MEPLFLSTLEYIWVNNVLFFFYISLDTNFNDKTIFLHLSSAQFD